MYASPAQKSTHPAERRVRKRGVAHWQAVSPCSAKRDASWGKQEGGRCPLLLSIVSTGSAGRAGRFFGASAQKNQFRVGKKCCGRVFVRSTLRAFFQSYRLALPVGRGDFSKRQRRKINSASVKNAADEFSSAALSAPFFQSYRPALPVGRGDYSERQYRKIISASVKNAADEFSSAALSAPFFRSYRPAPPVGRGDFSKR